MRHHAAITFMGYLIDITIMNLTHVTDVTLHYYHVNSHIFTLVLYNTKTVLLVKMTQVISDKYSEIL